jgi:hypothetical protein
MNGFVIISEKEVPELASLAKGCAAKLQKIWR